MIDIRARRSRYDHAPAVSHHACGSAADAGSERTPLLHCLHAEWVTGTSVQRGLPHVDQRLPELGIFVGQQGVHGHIHEQGVAVVRVAVGHGQLHRFDDRVDVVGRAMPHAFEIKPFEQPQGLAQIGALGPRAALVHLVAPVIDCHRLFDQSPMGGQVRAAQEPALLHVERL